MRRGDNKSINDNHNKKIRINLAINHI